MPEGIRLGHRQVVGVQVHPDDSLLGVGSDRHLSQLGCDEHPPALGVPLEPVTDGLARTYSPVSVVHDRGYHLLVPVGEPDIPDDDVLPVLLGQGVGHPEPEAEGPVRGDGGDAKLTAGGLIPGCP